MSRGLKKGFVYTYVVEVSFEANGKEHKESKSVKLRGGDIEELEFEAPAAPETPEPTADEVVTVVRLHVPQNATVMLAGNATKGSGSIRTFRTKLLKSGHNV